MAKISPNWNLFFLIIVLSIFSLLAMIVLLNKTQSEHRSPVKVRDVYVEWHTNFQDNDTSQLIVFRGADAEFRARHRAVVLNPTPHTGSDFFHHLILSNILTQRLNVKVYNEDELQNGTALSEVQRKRKLRMFIENVSKDDLVYIYTDIQVGNENFVIRGGYQFKPLSIIFMRDPIEAMVSSYHAHKFGIDVYKLYENQSDPFFNRRSDRLIKSLLKLNPEKESQLFARIISEASLARFLCSERCTGPKRSWTAKTLKSFAKATLESRTDNLIAIPMDDFYQIPLILQFLAPDVFHKLGDFDVLPSSVVSPPWTRVNISRKIPATFRKVLLSNQFIKMEYSLRNWMKKHYDYWQTKSY